MRCTMLTTPLIALGVGAVALGLSACTAATAEAPPGAPLLTASVDEDAGTIALPADQFFLTEAELDEVVSASGVAMINCLEAAGIESVEGRGRVIPDNDMSRVYGLWRMADAEQYGYITPESDEKLEALARNSRGGGEMSEAELAARHECATTPELIRFQNPYPKADWVSELSAASSAAESSVEWQAVISEWEECLADAGVEVEPGALTPTGLDYTAIDRREVTESDVRIAVADVTCKHDVDLIQRLADLEAAAQSPVIAQHRDEMLAARAELDAILADARRVLTEAGL